MAAPDDEFMDGMASENEPIEFAQGHPLLVCHQNPALFYFGNKSSRGLRGRGGRGDSCSKMISVRGGFVLFSQDFFFPFFRGRQQLGGEENVFFVRGRDGEGFRR